MLDEKKRHDPAADLPREHWDTWDPMLISEGLFAAANIFSNLKLVYIFSVNPYLGPLQVSLSRMVMDILKFITLFVLVLFAFSCGKQIINSFSFNNSSVQSIKNLFFWFFMYLKNDKIIKGLFS